MTTLVATRLTITGVVQGVGFRPFVHRLATQHEIHGWVRNESGRVEIHAEGDAPSVEAFRTALARELPPLASIERIECADDDVVDATEFRIVASNDARGARLPVPADVVTCDACAAELFDATSRRHRHAFTTCTNCGPRYTVIERLPYDRERTTLARFPLCARCQAEYDNPGDRRFHAESIACPDCGPHLWFEHAGDTDDAAHASTDGDALERAAAMLLHGGIVAVRGLGGYHLAADATNEAAVARLRARKRRNVKPLACMVRTLDEAREFVVLTESEAVWLTSRERPIVVAVRVTTAREGAPSLAPSLAPGLDHVGVMLPSTPLHHLLLGLTQRPLVMTSGNIADAPIAAGNDEARARLGGVADAFLMHDRDIAARIDDSVVRVAGDTPIVIRRARGYAPLPLRLPISSPVPLLAVGAGLKNTFTLVHGTHAYVSPHIGDLDSLEALEHWQATRARYETLFRIEPAAFVVDMHDGYLSTSAGDALAAAIGAPVLRVQHHHAHIAAILAEHDVRDTVLGLAFDGTGAGTDGTAWGMEFLLASLTHFTRVAHLRPAPLPGGDAAVRAGWRALAGFSSVGESADERTPAGVAFATAPRDGPSPLERRVVAQQIARHINAPLTSSLGRLFDAVASLLGVRHVSDFEGQAAMQLEALASNACGRVLPFPILVQASGIPTLDHVPLLSALARGRARGQSASQLAADFHASVVQGTLALVMHLRESHAFDTVALGGGCFQNALLLTALRDGIAALGLRVLVAKALPSNDGGVSFGQAAIGAARLAAGMTA